MCKIVQFPKIDRTSDTEVKEGKLISFKDHIMCVDLLPDLDAIIMDLFNGSSTPEGRKAMADLQELKGKRLMYRNTGG